MRQNPEVAFELLTDEEQVPPPITIDAAWHGIHFLLTGSSWDGEPPLSWVIMGGVDIGEDMGYGPARLLAPEAVQKCAKALEGIDRQQLSHRFDPQELADNEVFPFAMSTQTISQDDLDSYLGYYFDLVKAYYRDAAAAGDAMLLGIT